MNYGLVDWQCKSTSMLASTKVFLRMAILYPNHASFPTRKFCHIQYVTISQHLKVCKSGTCMAGAAQPVLASS